MSYKNYIAKIQYDDLAEIFHGEVINIKDIITFQGSSITELKKEFKNSIEDYFEFCAKRHENPEKPFSGKFNLRISPDLHRKAAVAAKLHNMSLNQWVMDIIKQEILKEKKVPNDNFELFVQNRMSNQLQIREDITPIDLLSSSKKQKKNTSKKKKSKKQS